MIWLSDFLILTEMISDEVVSGYFFLLEKLDLGESFPPSSTNSCFLTLSIILLKFKIINLSFKMELEQRNSKDSYLK